MSLPAPSLRSRVRSSHATNKPVDEEHRHTEGGPESLEPLVLVKEGLDVGFDPAQFGIGDEIDDADEGDMEGQRVDG